jgi:hypothetical protein
VGEEVDAPIDADADPFEQRRAGRWLRERLNRLRGRPTSMTCMTCGRYLPEVGATCRCGMTLLARSCLKPTSMEEFDARTNKV